MATSYTNSTFQVFSNKMGGRLREQYVGDAGEIFYDPNFPELFLSDGVTPGGIPILGSSTTDLTAYYTRPQVDQLFFDIVDGASANGSTLGGLELMINNNTTLINGLANTINNYVDVDNQTLSFDANTYILSLSNGNSVDLTPLSVNTTQVPIAASVEFLENINVPGDPEGTALQIRSTYAELNTTTNGVTDEIFVPGGRMYLMELAFTSFSIEDDGSVGEISMVNSADPTDVLLVLPLIGRGAVEGPNNDPVSSSNAGSWIIQSTTDGSYKFILTKCRTAANTATTLVQYRGNFNMYTVD